MIPEMSALALSSFLGLESFIALLFLKEEGMWLLPFFYVLALPMFQCK